MFQPIPFVGTCSLAMAAIIVLNAAGEATETIVPFRPGGVQAAVVPVYLDGRGPFDFLIDTGASSTIVDPELARAAGLEPEDRVLLVTAVGARPVPRGRLAMLGVGPHTLFRVEVLVSDLTEVRRESPGVRGVLGQNVLARISFGLDYRRRCVRFGGDEAGRGEEIPTERDDGRVVVVAQAFTRRGRSLRLVLDSGISSVMIFEKEGLSLGLDGTAWVAAQTAAGSMWLRTARLPRLQLGGVELNDLEVALVDERTAGGRSEDGLLPTSLFASVYFDNASRRTRLERR